MGDGEPNGDFPGLVVAGFRRRVTVEAPDGDRHDCLIRGRKLRPVCGDRVRYELDPHGNVVTGIGPRRTVLSRPDRRGREEVLAANVDRLVVVTALAPEPDPFVTDRYLAAAELMGVEAIVILNKTDLDVDAETGWLDVLARVGYPTLRTSARSGEGLSALAAHCAGHLNIFVGLSGVGKSSLLNALVPDLALRTAAISDASGEGRHTTTASVLHALPGGGAVIDSPGVRDYAPALVEPARVAEGYREIAALRQECRFHNCLHKNEPDCAVLAAVDDGTISERRYRSYRRLLNLMRQLGERFV